MANYIVTEVSMRCQTPRHRPTCDRPAELHIEVREEGYAKIIVAGPCCKRCARDWKKPIA